MKKNDDAICESSSISSWDSITMQPRCEKHLGGARRFPERRILAQVHAALQMWRPDPSANYERGIRTMHELFQARSMQSEGYTDKRMGSKYQKRNGLVVYTASLTDDKRDHNRDAHRHE